MAATETNISASIIRHRPMYILKLIGLFIVKKFIAG